MVSVKKNMSNTEFMLNYEEHLVWCESSSSSGTRLVLENASFETFAFSAEFNLAEAVFIKCNFHNCQFLGADLFAANFGLNSFNTCIFEDINFNKALVNSTTFNFCNFNRVTMIKSDLNKTAFIDCKLNECCFNGAYMVRGKFERCQISENCLFEGADMDFLQLVDTTLPAG